MVMTYQERRARRDKIVDYVLANPDKTMKEVAAHFKVSTTLVGTSCTDRGVPRPGNTPERRLQAAKKLVEVYTATGSFVTALQQSNIPQRTAKAILRGEGFNLEYRPEHKRTNSLQTSTTWKILSHLFNRPELSRVEIAKLLGTEPSRVSQVAATARYLNIPIPAARSKPKLQVAQNIAMK